jgi:hypothetical protein
MGVHPCPHCKCVPPPIFAAAHDVTAPFAGLVLAVVKADRQETEEKRRRRRPVTAGTRDVRPRRRKALS